MEAPFAQNFKCVIKQNKNQSLKSHNVDCITLKVLCTSMRSMLFTYRIITVIVTFQMWIYSLGITLRRTIQSLSGANNGNQPRATTAGRATALLKTTSAFARTSESGNCDKEGEGLGGGNDNIRQQHKSLTSLEYVIRAMCAPNIHYRASLMYLLDVSITANIIHVYVYVFVYVCIIFSINFGMCKFGDT